MACKNTACKYNSYATSANGCKLFPGESWLSCRGARVAAPVKQNIRKSKSIKE